MSYLKTLYRLDVKKHNELPFKIDVKGSITVGADPRNDIVLVGKKSLTKHLIFEPKGENLSLYNLGQTNQTFLNSIPLEFNKSYLLEVDDHVQISELEIIVGQIEIESKANWPTGDQIQSKESNERSTRPVAFHSLNDLVPEKEIENEPIQLELKVQKVQNNQNIPNIKRPIVKVTPTRSIISLLVIKLYALLSDFFLTFFLLSFLIPLAGVQESAFSIFQAVSELLSSFSTHSFWPFFCFFYFLRLIQILIFGTSFGQLLVGLGSIPKTTVMGMIVLRFKIVFCALCLYPAQNQISNHFLFSALRKVGILLLFLFILISPHFIPQSLVTDLGIPEKAGPLELNTVSYLTYSENYNLTLELEIPPRYQIFPFTKKDFQNSFGIKVYDLKEKANLEIIENQTLLMDSIEETLRFSNPLLSFYQKLPLRDRSLQDQKLIIQKILLTSIKDIPSQMKSFGIFYANNVFAKNFILNKIEKKDLQLRAFSKEAPFLSLENQSNFYTLLFSGVKLTFLKHDKTKGNSALQNLAHNQILNRWKIKEKNTDYQRLDFLETLDALKRQDEPTILTYYINSAKKPHGAKILYREEDLTKAYKAALISNINDLIQTMTLKNTKTSLEEITKQLTPMENPGDKR